MFDQEMKVFHKTKQLKVKIFSSLTLLLYFVIHTFFDKFHVDHVLTHLAWIFWFDGKVNMSDV